jgi:hypothetical protein
MIIFVENKILTERENLEENLRMGELATLRKKRSGLPANLYIDHEESYINAGHWKRIKFQPNTGDHPITRDMVPMSIEDDPKILAKDVKISLNAKQLNQIKAFVKANKNLLLLLSDRKITLADFCKRMVKV